MEFPKTTSELAIWLGMQFPVLAATTLLAYWAVRYTERLHEKRMEDSRKLYDGLLGEKETRIRERDDRIRHLQSEVVELRAKLSRSKKPTDEPKPDAGGGVP